MVRDAAARLGVDVTVEKVADYAEIARFGIVSTPGIVIDGKVVYAGGSPRQDALDKWLVA
jgi:predicted thioredoxin/glutaredoxin